MTPTLTAVTHMHPLRPPLASRAHVDMAWGEFLYARRHALESKRDIDALAALVAFVSYQRALADWEDGR